MEQLAQLLIFGLLLGAIYALMALGLTLIFGVMRMVSFAHGEFYMLGSFAFALAALHFPNVPPPIALVSAPLAAFAVGWLSHKLLLSAPRVFTRFKHEEYMLILTFGLSIVMQNTAVILAAGGFFRPPSLIEGRASLGEITVSGDRLAAAAAAAVAMLALWLFMRRTYVGRGWRAMTQSRLGATVVGVNAEVMSRWAFATSCALAGLAGGLLAPLYFAFPTNGTPALVQGFAIIVIGGMGSIPGSLVGGLLVGVANALGTGYISSSFGPAYGFILMIILLLVRPRGLFGEQTRSF